MTNLPATVQLSTLSQEIGVLKAKLAPAESSSIAGYLLSMRKAGMALPHGMKAEDLETVYGYALSDVPAAGLKRCVEKIIKGEYEIERGFIPKPPELAAMARAEAKTIRDDLARLRERQETLQSLQPSPAQDEGAKERVRALLGRFRAERQAQTAQPSVPHEPMDDERCAYWAKVKSLPDAKEISAEQMAFRRKVEMDLAAVDRKEAAE